MLMAVDILGRAAESFHKRPDLRCHLVENHLGLEPARQAGAQHLRERGK